jgi:aryl-alcohol dehydrogenase-like predicted oxidoreductase
MSIVRRQLGRTGVGVTILGYGAMELGGQPIGPALTDRAAGRLLNTVLDTGINLIDTSIEYGRSEELIGRHVSRRRDEYFVATKCGCPLQVPPSARPPYAHDYSSANVRANVEQSLRRLRTDRLDLLQVHMSPSTAQLAADDTVATLNAMRDEGKLQFIGMSGVLPHLPDHIAMSVFDVFQIPYSAIQREHEQLISEAAAAGAGTLIRGGVARGAPAEDKNWRIGPFGLAEGEGQRRWEDSDLASVLGGMSPMEFMLRFTLSHPDLSTTIVGTANIDHLHANVAEAEKGPLPVEVYERAKKLLKFHPTKGGLPNRSRR